MSQYKTFLDNIQIPEVNNNDEDKLTIEDLMAIHPSLTPESVELWAMFLTLRPDLPEEEKADIMAIIHKLKLKETNNFNAIMRDMKKRQAERPKEIGENECIVTPLA
jgi:hypothetical protein